MSKRYKNMGREPDSIFARADKAAKEREPKFDEVLEREEEEIDHLASDPVFWSWLKRIVRQQGGMFNNVLKTEAGQAQGMALYCIARDLARTGAGQLLVTEIVSEQFGKTKKGSN